MTTTCTITKSGRCDTYGRPLLVGQSYTSSDDEIKSLWQAGFCSVTDAPTIFDNPLAASFPSGRERAIVTAETNPVTGGIESTNDIVRRLTGLELSVLPFSTAGYTYAGGSINALSSIEQYVVVNLRTGLLHCLPRLGDHGVIPLARVVATATSVTVIDNIQPAMPVTYLPKTIAKLKAREPIKLSILGSSLLQSTDQVTQHIGLLFQQQDLAYGYSVINPDNSKERNNDPNFQSIGVGWSAITATGFEILGAGGAYNSPCLEWGGAGLLFRELGGPNIGTTASVQVVAVSGTPSVEIIIKDKATDTVRGTSGAVAITRPTTLTARGVTQGVQPGTRAQILVTGGRVRLSKWSVRGDSGSIATFKNAALGGSNASWNLACVGKTYKNQNITTNDEDKGVEITHAYSAYSLNDPVGTPQSTVLDADLVIIGSLANDGVDRDLFHSPIFHALRDAGCEVLVVTDSPKSPSGTDPANWAWYKDGPLLMAKAQEAGCAVADTAAYMAEAFLRGYAIYVDTIHQTHGRPGGVFENAPITGDEVWARATSAVVSPFVNRLPVVIDTPFRAADAAQPGDARVILAPDIKVVSGTAALAASAGSSPGYTDFCTQFGVAATRCQLRISSGAKVSFAHPMMLRAQMIFQGNDFVAEVRRAADATLIRTINFNAAASGGVITFLRDLVLPAELATLGGNAGITITVTSGALWLMAIVVQTPLYRDVTRNLVFGGAGWANESTSQADVIARYTDTVNDWVTASDENCRSLVIATNETAGGGVVIPVYDGLIQSDATLTGTANFRYRKTPDANRGRHTMTLKLKTAGSTAAQARSLSVVQAFAVVDR